MKGLKKSYKPIEKKAGSAILLSDQTEFNRKKVVQDSNGHNFLGEGNFCQYFCSKWRPSKVYKAANKYKNNTLTET